MRSHGDLLAAVLGGAPVPLSDYDTVDAAELRTEQGVIWTDREQVLFGESVAGTLVVSSTVSG